MRRMVNVAMALACVGLWAGALRAAAPAGGGMAGAGAGAAAAPAPAGEQVENPAYKAWASHKPGTTLVTKRTVEFGGNPNESTVTQKLTAVTPEKVTLEQTTEGGFGGGAAGGGPQSIDIPAKIAKDQVGVATMGFGRGGGRGNRGGGAGAPPAPTVKDMKTGTDKVDVNGKSVEAKTYEYSTELAGRGGAAGMTMKAKTWYSDSVPGAMVKSEMSGEGPNGAISIKSSVVKFEEGTGAATPAK